MYLRLSQACGRGEGQSVHNSAVQIYESKQAAEKNEQNLKSFVLCLLVITETYCACLRVYGVRREGHIPAVM